LISFAQGEKMTNHQINIIDSILTVRASGTDLNVEHDLSLPTGKSIAQLLNDQENNQATKEDN
jgi:hypothetical protein